MQIELARQIAARIWCDAEMKKFPMDTELAETIAQLISTIDMPSKPDTRKAIRDACSLTVFCLTTDLMMAELQLNGNLFETPFVKFSDKEYTLLTNSLTNIVNALINNRESK